MLFKSPVYSQASGSVAGLVYSHNAGGMYVRARATPTNPNTEPQQAVRTAMAQLVQAWTVDLTADQRDAWNVYAFNTPTLNRLGEATSKNGQQMYIRSNVARLQAELERVDDAPTIFDVGSFTPDFSPTADESAQTITIDVNIADDWALEDGSSMLVYMGRPQNPTRNFGKGPYQLLTIINGVPMTGPTTPVVANSIFPLALGQKVFLKYNVTRADGRYSNAQRVDTIVVA